MRGNLLVNQSLLNAQRQEKYRELRVGTLRNAVIMCEQSSRTVTWTDPFQFQITTNDIQIKTNHIQIATNGIRMEAN